MATVAANDPMLPQPHRVRQVVKETPDTFTLTLEPSDGAGSSPFRPGQFSMLWVFGVGELPISISGHPAEPDRLVYTVRSVGSATHAFVGHEAGDSVGVRGPFGTGWPVEAARGRDVIIVAGGIGLAPLRPVIYEVLHNRNDYGRLVVLYGARSPRDLLYRKELAAWARQRDTQVLVTVDYGGLSWRGHVGVVTTLFKYARLHPARSVAMVCGPEIMMRFVTRELETHGLARADIYLSMERNMKCAVGFCGHCQYGPHFICKDGPVFPYEQMRPLLEKYEL
ncbi:Cytosolic bidirectional (NiFe)-hydrogenases (NADP coupled, Group 3b), diaphorase subunit [Candidatus Sulfotelmatobacter sp. SbA7]|nr:Cytosolic bidirectional (NiFe)-hydrogenases (NADP coupled, Group 3b), diaphorase subunit [Candidatus Sulfotelmatobacter sp. SbA7]